MGVLIKDMKMPKSCKSCDLLQDYDGDMYCPLNSYLNFGDIEYVPDYVMIGCPISEAPERKKGKWIYKDDLKQYFCSECGYPSLTYDDVYIYGMDLPKFCEECGSDMRGEQE